MINRPFYIYLCICKLSQTLHQREKIVFHSLFDAIMDPHNVFHRLPIFNSSDSFLITNSIEFLSQFAFHFLWFPFSVQKESFGIMHCICVCVIPILGRMLHICYFPCAIFYTCQFELNGIPLFQFILYTTTLGSVYNVQCSVLFKLIVFFSITRRNLLFFIYYV